jgi:ATP-dependent Lhr-like helicase
MPEKSFHPAVADWFRHNFDAPTPAQAEAWPAIGAGHHTLIAAPTGSGKTLAAFLAAIDELVREGLEHGLEDETRVLYVSPLKALSNDVQKNLEAPLAGIRDSLLEHQLADVDIRAVVRTGDTPAGERERMRRRPPHILVTTPESLYILLGSESGRRMLATVRSVIVDEIHALAGNKRGSHLSLSLERLAALCSTPPIRIGLSATQKPLDRIARFLIGNDARECRIVDTGHVRERDLALELTASPLEAVMPAEAWSEIYDRLAELAQEHRTTLVFVNTRRLAERAARFLAERIGDEWVTAHHGSLAREHRLDAEQRLKNGELRILVATASLELGIDIGDVDLVCQLGSPRSIAAFLQRVGRSGHAVGATPRGRLFPLTRDDLVECVALLDAVRRDELDRIIIPAKPLDVLAQHIVAEVASREWKEEQLFEHLCRAWPYRELKRAEFTDVVRMLSEGYTTRRGRRGAYLHRDAVNGLLRGRRGARMTALMNGGAIADQFDYDVVLVPDGHSIGSLNEDFAFESMPGDIFQLGNTSYRMLKIEQGKVYVEDAHGQPPNIPFWVGEAPGRTDELSMAVSRLRATADALLGDGTESLLQWLTQELKLSAVAAQQLAEYLAAARAALEAIPSQDTIVFERFFDEKDDMHFVIHAPFGSRINRAWGLSLRKRFCRKFNFELQAAATDDSIVLSLGPTHSFPLEEPARYLHADSVRTILVQALLDAPMFATRWRWNANISLAVPRMRNGKRVPAQFQRSDAEDLVAVVFPDQLACFENISGDREVPDHPLVTQTLADCLHDTMDIEGLENLLRRLSAGEIRLVTQDLAAPSPLAQEIINARPYAFLDGAPAEERRTLAIREQRHLDPQSAAELGQLDPDAIARVRKEAWPAPENVDELHDALNVTGFVNEDEVASSFWQDFFAELMRQSRACVLVTKQNRRLWVAAERLAQLQAVFPDSRCEPAITALNDIEVADRDEALREIVRSRLESTAMIAADALARASGLDTKEIEVALLALEQEGFAIRGDFTRSTNDTEWCERGLLARAQRYTLNRRRAEIEPVSASVFMRFLFRWQGLDERGEGPDALARVMGQLEGLALPAAAWEQQVLPARMDHYQPSLLDTLCTTGQLVWLRPPPPKETTGKQRKAAPVRVTPITFMPRVNAIHWRANLPPLDEQNLSANALKIHDALAEHGASFFVDLVQETGLLRTQVEDALAELVALGRVTADSFAGLRALLLPQNRRASYADSRRRRVAATTVDAGGRWSLVRRTSATPTKEDEWVRVEHVAQTLMRRYGVVFRRLLEREAGLPPWRDLLYAYRRLEARGEIRGGRFVQGFAGEQFALPEAVGLLRELRRTEANEDFISISAADPLNLTGIITPGSRVPANTGNRVLYRDGIPLAVSVGGKVEFFGEVAPQTEWEARHLLLRQHNAAAVVRGPERSI